MTATVATSKDELGEGTLELHNEALETLFQRLSELSSLPSIALRIIEAAVDEGTDAEDLRQLIEKDPALSARIIRIVNSSFYGVRQEVADLRSAIALLGTKQIRNVAITVFVSRQFNAASSKDTLDRNRLWNHSMAVGAIARLLAKSTHKADSEEAYLAGLLHDMGLLIIDQHLARHVPRIRSTMEEGSTLHEAVHRILTFDPSQLGAYVAWRSKFPSRLISAIEFHQKPDDFKGDERELTDLVAVADYVATRNGVGVMLEAEPLMPPATVFERLGLSEEILDQMLPQIEETLSATKAMAAA
ncbi:HDOD domain-containing protein [Aeoliella mucimassa]|uniref:Putative nicotinate-nucleotide adenylyltransferase n=1 Tax=Aeoliella mucimassa TaxID=2527972 RepID=A0A518AQW0_9BACT|nr:HDOD domain-containing protein [Aeoliella mucimassa]QDU57104.1 putative nicotinate-nucleotide adenylyltransferase [Aeoliella mucimassa]